MTEEQSTDSPSVQKISKLVDELEKLNEGKDFTRIVCSRGEDSLSLEEIARGLFSKAPLNVIQRSLDDLQRYTLHSCQALNQVVSGEVRSFEVVHHNERYSLVLAQPDRPFVMNSIRECIQESGIVPSFFLHPIFILNGFRYSLVYIELGKVSAEQVDLLRKNIEDSMNDLRLVTDDFTSMLVRTETLARILQQSKSSSLYPDEEKREVADFLHWLTDGGCIFLGYAEWRIADDDSTELQDNSLLGVYKSHLPYKPELHTQSQEDATHVKDLSSPVLVTRLKIRGSVQARGRIINISVKETNASGKCRAVHSIIGFFTSKALAQESSSVPLIRKKLKEILELEEVHDNSFDYKNIVKIIDSMPKDEIFRMDTLSLREVVHTILSIQHDSDTRVSVRFDSARRGVSVLIVLPRDRFNSRVRDSIQNHIESVFSASPGSSEYHLDLTSKSHARLYFYIPINTSSPTPVDLATLELNIAELSRTWENNLEDKILHSDIFHNTSEVWSRYSTAFGDDYKALQTVDEAILDIAALEELSDSRTIRSALSRRDEGIANGFTLIIYHRGTALTLSRALPILENIGLEVVTERSFRVKPRNGDELNISRFVVKAHLGERIDDQHFNLVIGPALEAALYGTVQNDTLNSLTISAGLDIRSISLLRAYCNLLWQVNKFATREAIYHCLANTPLAAKQFIEMFGLKFDPESEAKLSQRESAFQGKLSDFKDGLRQVTDITSDRILRALADLLEHTVRTNFYTSEEALALKIHSKQVSVIQAPRPLYEIFVYSSQVEGIHLRAGKIARGGIRWSDRHEDYRTEILGLMKTQKIKNALIVPDGAKGGFVIHNPPDNRNDLMIAGERGYKTYIRALLSITDNRVDREVVRPEGLIVYDDDDPYFVVAADRGTTSFSDIANEIAVRDFDFWLGDAFASGGSKGYNHKDYGITAKGSWECIKQHFRDLEIDYEKEPFTVAGIGDMSGDVFGNSMILSDQIRLIAAFNHKHIFIDPKPDPAESYKERKRLFELSRSQWTDYDRKKMSKGGGIFGRFDKEIKLTKPIKAALGVADECPDTVNGEDLVKLILKAECDLLWNGGIGTYIKARNESHADVNDGTNDRVRIDATEVRARVIGEGGNLGLTQLARIEYARCGGIINTDAIDNSAGVDLSDHEVNLKILLAELVRKGEISPDERDSILLEVADEVVEQVLTHNRNHALILSLGVGRAKKHVEFFDSLIGLLVKSEVINRSVEFLPDNDELAERARLQRGLERPELAICLGGMKTFIKELLIQSPLVEDPLLKTLLLSYFPTTVVERFQDEILDHPLARHIIASQITNMLIDGMGVSFIHRMCVKYSVSPIDIVKCSLAASLTLGLERARREIARFNTFSQQALFVSLVKEINGAMREASSWIMGHHKRERSLNDIVSMYRDPFREIIDGLPDVAGEYVGTTWNERMKELKELRIDEGAKRSIAAYPFITFILETLGTAQRSEQPVVTVGPVFAKVAETFGIISVMELAIQIQPTDKWESMLVSNSVEEIKVNLSHITEDVIKNGATEANQVERLLSNSPQFEQLKTLIEEVSTEGPSGASLSVIARQLKIFRVA